MTCRPVAYRRHRFPPEIISHAVWLYYRFCLSFRDVEDLLAQRSITVTYETVRQWCAKFGRDYARRLRRREGRLGDTWHLDEVFVTITVLGGARGDPDLFQFGRHLLRAVHHRLFRQRAFGVWAEVTCA